MASNQSTKCEICGIKLPDFSAAAAHVSEHEAVKNTASKTKNKSLWRVSYNKDNNIKRVLGGLPLPEQPSEEQDDK